MNKTKVFLYVLLVLGLVCLGISVVQSITKGMPVDWSSAGVFFAVLTVALSSVESKEQKKKEKEA
ncbi:MAG: hypothetical protein K6B69_04900 [Lachnospiraceae bacterium]|nr:hypothetical protein [Lachnospiraceae bacterium]